MSNKLLEQSTPLTLWNPSDLRYPATKPLPQPISSTLHFILFMEHKFVIMSEHILGGKPALMYWSSYFEEIASYGFCIVYSEKTARAFFGVFSASCYCFC